MTARLADLVWGLGSERRVLLLHGLSSSAQTWWRVASMLTESGIESTAVDLRGHGRSPRTDAYALSDFAADVEAHIARHGPYDVIVGHSLGGSVAAVADVGDTARVLVDPVIDTPDPSTIRAELLAELDMTMEQISEANPSWHPDDVHWKHWSAGVVTGWAFRAMLDDLLPMDITGAAAGLRGRCIVLAADSISGGLISSRARAVLEVNPSIEVEDLAGIGHSVQREAPSIVSEAVLRLI